MINKGTIKELSSALQEPAWMLKKRLDLYGNSKFKNDDILQYGSGIGSDYTIIDFDNRDFSVSGVGLQVLGADVMHFDEALNDERAKKIIRGHIFINNNVISSNKFFSRNGYLFTDGYYIRVSKKLNKKQIELLLTQKVENSLTYILIHVESGVDIKILETIDVKKYHGVIIDIVIDQGSHVEYTSVQNINIEDFLFISRNAEVSANALIQWMDVNIGGKAVKSSIYSKLIGDGAVVNMYGIFFQNCKQSVDIYTAVDHLARNTMSDILVKGALDGESKGLYRSLIKISENSSACRGSQKEETLMLSENASMHSVPDLEIANNDVSCSHGITTSRIDDEKIFYMESRGVEEKDAIRSLTDGHLASVLCKIEDDELEADIMASINKKINN